MGFSLSRFGQVLGGISSLAHHEAGDASKAGKDLFHAIPTGDGSAAGNDLKSIRDSFINFGGGAIGYSELLGLKFPVKVYSAQVTPTLSRGSRLEKGGLDALEAQGFKGVVNLCAENDADTLAATRLGMNSLHLPIIDNTAPTEAQMKQFLDFATNPANQPTYVHCEAGQGRTGVAVACYRMAVQGWTPDQAMAEAKSYGLKMPVQEEFIRQFGADLAAGKIAGYPKTE